MKWYINLLLVLVAIVSGLYNLIDFEDTSRLSRLLGGKIVMTLAQRTFLAQDLTSNIPNDT